MSSETPDRDADSPTIRQRLHSATGDRQAEAEALADRAEENVSDEQAETAVRAAHGDIKANVSRDGRDALEEKLASPDEAKEAKP